MTLTGLLLALCAGICLAASADDGANLAGSAEVSVDSTFPGYSTQVLTDGEWIAPGEEITDDVGSPDRLGNYGNTWVSAAKPGEHWVRLDWPGQVSVGRVEIWWSQEQWYPKAFRVEYLSDQSWVPVLDARTWLAPTERRSELRFEPVQTDALRVIQHGLGGPERGLMAMQELRVFAGTGEIDLTGARELTRDEIEALSPFDLPRNVATLHLEQPGASAPVAWTDDGTSVQLPALADGDPVRAVEAPDSAIAIGIEWPIQHVIDGLTLTMARGSSAPEPLRAEIRAEGRWFGIETGLEHGREDGRLTLRFEPLAADAVRVLHDGRGVTELAVYRYMPDGPHEWPERLVADNLLEAQILALPEEPSFERLATVALSMRPTWALLGLKDRVNEAAVDWDGTIWAGETISFAYGPERLTMAAYADTVTRRLIDGWRPGTVVAAQMGDVRVTQTAFVARIDSGDADGHVLVRAQFEGADAVTLIVGEGPERVFEAPNGVLCLAIPVGGGAAVTKIDEHLWASALEDFREYWDDLLPRDAWLELPEKRLNDLYRAVLAQLLINADGDIMPYGAGPSAYEGKLYGVEEGFAMMALAQFGLAQDAARYMDATYLTDEFLRKVPKYTGYADRHQQYRNGLQPTYAVQLYRLTGDRAWIEGHIDLIREAAEWTIEQRRRTMVEEDGERPLHWGLLPKWSYGGDIAGLQCHALYPNFACWRGMLETAWLMERRGEADAARRYYDEASAYRALLEGVVDRIYRDDQEPPFLPLRIYGEEPVGDDYYQLFAGTLLDLFPFDLAGHRLRYVTDYLEDGNLTFCLMPRFRRDVGAGGLDGLYGLGYMLTKLHQDRIDEFLLGFYGYLAFNLERDTFAARETNLIYASDLHVRSEYRVPDISDPVPCSAAVPLLLLREMLVAEARSGGDLPGDELHLLRGAPRRWFADGETIRLRNMPTHFGEISCEVVSAADDGRIEATVVAPRRPGSRWEAIHLRLRHPEGLTLRSVTVNGNAWSEFDPGRETITLRPGAQTYRVVAAY